MYYRIRDILIISAGVMLFSWIGYFYHFKSSYTKEISPGMYQLPAVWNIALKNNITSEVYQLKSLNLKLPWQGMENRSADRNSLIMETEDKTGITVMFRETDFSDNLPARLAGKIRSQIEAEKSCFNYRFSIACLNETPVSLNLMMSPERLYHVSYMLIYKESMMSGRPAAIRFGNSGKWGFIAYGKPSSDKKIFLDLFQGNTVVSFVFSGLNFTEEQLEMIISGFMQS